MLEFNTYLIYRLSVLFFTLHNNPRNLNDQPMKSSRTEDMDEAPRLHEFTKEELSQYLIDCQLLNPTEADEIKVSPNYPTHPVRGCLTICLIFIICTQKEVYRWRSLLSNEPERFSHYFPPRQQITNLSSR